MHCWLVRISTSTDSSRLIIQPIYTSYIYMTSVLCCSIHNYTCMMRRLPIIRESESEWTVHMMVYMYNSHRATALLAVGVVVLGPCDPACKAGHGSTGHDLARVQLHAQCNAIVY